MEWTIGDIYKASLIIGETRLAIPPRRSCSASCSDVLLQVSCVKHWDTIIEAEKHTGVRKWYHHQRQQRQRPHQVLTNAWLGSSRLCSSVSLLRYQVYSDRHTDNISHPMQTSCRNYCLNLFLEWSYLRMVEEIGRRCLDTCGRSCLLRLTMFKSM